MSKTLVVFYSLTGNTRTAAEEFVQLLGEDCDLAEIHDRSRRGTGKWAMFKSVLEVILGRCPGIRYAGPDPARYGMVVIGTPVWCGKVASPVRSFVREQGDRLPRVAALVTSGSGNGESAARHLEDLLSWNLDGEVSLSDAEIRSGEFRGKLEKFAKQIEPAPDLAAAR